MAFVRSYNPKWFFNDLVGKPLNDEYYAFFLTNTLPYQPQVVYRDPQGLTVWTGGIVQFEPSGGLPDNLYFNEFLTYRIEIRHGNTQFDPLIWEINNYQASLGDEPPPGEGGESDENQISNPEFVEVNFNPEPTTVTALVNPTLIDVAPGWVIEAVGTGTINLQRIPVKGTDDIITNPAYVLRINAFGPWTDLKLRQRFDNNGALFKSSTQEESAVSGAFIAVNNVPGDVTSGMFYRDSTGAASEVAIIPVATITGAYQMFSDAAALPNIPQNPQDSDIAYVDIYIRIPNNCDISLSSIQIVKQVQPAAVEYIQESPARHRDHLFHYYKNSILLMPKESLLTGWVFGQNPWQFRSQASSNVTFPCDYTADQTIIYQQGGANSVAVAKGTASEDRAFEVKAVGAANKFAMIQYIDTETMNGYWGSKVSALVTLRKVLGNPTSQVRFKMRLIYRADAVPVIGPNQPINSWGGTDPDFVSAGWAVIIPPNDPIYTISTIQQSLPFNGIQLPVATTNTMTLGIAIYTIDPMNNVGTPEKILFDRVSLVRNDFAIDTNVLTFDESLRRCQFYYETSKNLNVIPTVSGAEGAILRATTTIAGGTGTLVQTLVFPIEFSSVKCRPPVAAGIIMYAENGVINEATVHLRNAANTETVGNTTAINRWIPSNIGNKSVMMLTNTLNNIADFAVPFVAANKAYIGFHYTADARLGEP